MLLYTYFCTRFLNFCAFGEKKGKCKGCGFRLHLQELKTLRNIFDSKTFCRIISNFMTVVAKLSCGRAVEGPCYVPYNPDNFEVLY